MEDPIAVGKFEVYTDKSGKFRFRLKAANGQIIASGEGYESVKKNASDAPVVEVGP